MTRTTNKSIGALAAVLVTVALAPATSAANTDLRSADARDAGRASETRGYQDLRSPDAREAGVASSDRPRSPTATGESNGSDSDAVEIAAGGFVALVALGGFVLIRHRSGAVRISRAPGRVA